MRRVILNYIRINTKATVYQTIIAFVLIPLLALVRLFYPGPVLDYGHRDATVNSWLLLLFGIYASYVVIINFVQCHNSWKTGATQWKTQLILGYIFVFIFGLSIPFLMMFQALESYNYASYPERYTETGWAAFQPECFIGGLIYDAPAFLFPTGIALFFLGLAGFQHLYRQHKLYLVTIFITSILFTICGAPCAFIIFAWFLKGGINPW